MFNFPEDNKNQSEYTTEWWHLVGHLEDKQKNPLAFQITFFRLSNGDTSNSLTSPYSVDLAVLVNGRQQVFKSRLVSRESFGKSKWELDIRYDDLKLILREKIDTLNITMNFDKHIELNLACRPIKKSITYKRLVSHRGGSGALFTNCITFSRVALNGTVFTNGDKKEVKGSAWIDHEFSNELPSGWDWAGIQLYNGEEIIAGQSRSGDGTVDVSPFLTMISKNGTIKAQPCTWEVLESWKSPRSSISYPVKIRISTKDSTFELRPLIYDQERMGLRRYWEGACNVIDNNEQVIGKAFLELVGYY